jgi:hypothetical protein
VEFTAVDIAEFCNNTSISTDKWTNKRSNTESLVTESKNHKLLMSRPLSWVYSRPHWKYYLPTYCFPRHFPTSTYRHICISPPKLVQCSLWFYYSDTTFIIKCTSYCIPHRALYLVWRNCSLCSFCRETGDHLKTSDQAFVYRCLELCFWKCRKWQLFSSAAW